MGKQQSLKRIVVLVVIGWIIGVTFVAYIVYGLITSFWSHQSISTDHFRLPKLNNQELTPSPSLGCHYEKPAVCPKFCIKGGPCPAPCPQVLVCPSPTVNK